MSKTIGLPTNGNSTVAVELDSLVAGQATSRSPALAGPIGPVPGVSRSLNIDDLSDRWIDYTGIDCFAIRQSDLKTLVEKHRRQWGAIRSAVAAGANLLIYEVSAEQVAELDRYLGLPPSPETSAADKIEQGIDPNSSDSLGWKAISRPIAIPDNPSPQAVEDFDVQSVPSATATTQPSPPPVVALHPAIASPPTESRVHGRSLGRGLVLSTVESLAFDAIGLNGLLQHVPTHRAFWNARHGLSLDPELVSANRADFWTFLIPGVGLTPVVEFQILITLFVLVIGPLNFFLLRRWQRLNLLVFTAPITAAIVTLLLVGYAMVADGLGVRVRARTFTQIDQRRGEAVCWSRLSFYAGLTPRQDLKFSEDVAVYPFRQESAERIGIGAPPTRQWNWGDTPADPAGSTAAGAKEQRLSRDWLPARTPTQFVTVRSRESPARLDVKISADGSTAKIANHLGVRIRKLFVRDTADHYFSGENVVPDGAATLSSSAASSFIALDLGDPLSLPPGSRLDWFESSSFSRRYGMRTYSTNNLSAPAQGGGMLELSLKQASTHLAPGHYVAIVDRSPELELGVESAREEASLHVVAGNW